MGTCTIIASGSADTMNFVQCCVPIREALDKADYFKRESNYSSVRVYSESGNGGTLTLIYVAP